MTSTLTRSANKIVDDDMFLHIDIEMVLKKNTQVRNSSNKNIEICYIIGLIVRELKHHSKLSMSFS